MFLVTLSSLPCVADTSAQYRVCSENAKTQARMNACANEEVTRGDAEANGIYRALVARTSRQPEALAKVKAAERAWIVYRDRVHRRDVSRGTQTGRVRLRVSNGN